MPAERQQEIMRLAALKRIVKVRELADDLGVDELGLGDSGVSVGKRISDQLYLTYEAGLSGAASTLYIFYDITRRFTLRGESGEATALDLIYSFDFD